MNQLIQDSEVKPSNSVQNSEMPDLSDHLHHSFDAPWPQPSEYLDLPELRDMWFLPGFQQGGSLAANQLTIQPSEGPDIDPNVIGLTDSNDLTSKHKVDEAVSIDLEDNLESSNPEIPGALPADDYEKGCAAAPAALDVALSWPSQMETQVARLCEGIEKTITNEVERHLSDIAMAFSANATNELDASEAERRHCSFEDSEGDLHAASSTNSRTDQLEAGRGAGVCIESQLERTCLQVRQDLSEVLHRSVKEQIRTAFRVGLLAHQEVNTHCEEARSEKGSDGSFPIEKIAGGKQPLICPHCQKLFQRQCNLKCVFQHSSILLLLLLRLTVIRKHLKRHERPYGCTYPGCLKGFGSKNDWRRHEETQHSREEMWICQQRSGCEPKRGCGQAFNKKELFRQHLRQQHRITDVSRIKGMSKESRSHIWCGFCTKTIELDQSGFKGRNERFDHIEMHFNQGERITDWVPIDRNPSSEPWNVLQAAAFGIQDDEPAFDFSLGQGIRCPSGHEPSDRYPRDVSTSGGLFEFGRPATLRSSSQGGSESAVEIVQLDADGGPGVKSLPTTFRSLAIGSSVPAKNVSPSRIRSHNEDIVEVVRKKKRKKSVQAGQTHDGKESTLDGVIECVRFLLLPQFWDRSTADHPFLGHFQCQCHAVWSGIHAHCSGGGCEISSSCDHRFCDRCVRGFSFGLN